MILKIIDLIFFFCIQAPILSLLLLLFLVSIINASERNFFYSFLFPFSFNLRALRIVHSRSTLVMSISSVFTCLGLGEWVETRYIGNVILKKIRNKKKTSSLWMLTVVFISYVFSFIRVDGMTVTVVIFFTFQKCY